MDESTGNPLWVVPIGFAHEPPPDPCEAEMSDPDIRALVLDIHERVIRLDTHREGDTRSMDLISRRLDTMESRLWGAYGGLGLVLIAAILGAVI